MNDKNWTEGPWFVRKWDGEEWPEKRISIGPQDNHTAQAVAISPRYVEEDQMLADAYLLAKAQELYYLVEHVENLVTKYENGESVPEGDEDLNEWARKARKVMAEARGEYE